MDNAFFELAEPAKHLPEALGHVIDAIDTATTKDGWTPDAIDLYNDAGALLYPQTHRSIEFQCEQAWAQEALFLLSTDCCGCSSKPRPDIVEELRKKAAETSPRLEEAIAAYERAFEAEASVRDKHRQLCMLLGDALGVIPTWTPSLAYRTAMEELRRAAFTPGAAGDIAVSWARRAPAARAAFFNRVADTMQRAREKRKVADAPTAM
jgi:hypothetical protein